MWPHAKSAWPQTLGFGYAESTHVAATPCSEPSAPARSPYPANPAPQSQPQDLPRPTHAHAYAGAMQMPSAEEMRELRQAYEEMCRTRGAPGAGPDAVPMDVAALAGPAAAPFDDNMPCDPRFFANFSVPLTYLPPPPHGLDSLVLPDLPTLPPLPVRSPPPLPDYDAQLWQGIADGNLDAIDLGPDPLFRPEDLTLDFSLAFPAHVAPRDAEAGSCFGGAGGSTQCVPSSSLVSACGLFS